MSSYTICSSKQFVALLYLATVYITPALVTTNSLAEEFIVNDIVDAIDLDINDGICKTSNNKCSLRAAIQQSNALEGSDTITLPAGTYTLSKSIGVAGDEFATRGDLDITDAVSIYGNSTVDTIVDGNNFDRIFHVHHGAALTLQNITLQNGNADDGKAGSNGGGIYNSSDAILKLLNSKLISNRTSKEGGALFNQGIAVIENTEFVNNSATSVSAEGGAIANDRTGFMILDHLFITGNSAGNISGASSGGGIYNRSTELFLSNVTVENNAASYGGGIYITGTAFIHELVVASNQATFGGGVYFAITDESSLQKVIVSGNTANTGGGIYMNPSAAMLLTIDFATINDNTSNGIIGGGGMYVQDGKVNLSRSLINGNVAEKGGAIKNVNGQIKLSNVTISGNHASESGGGIEQDGNGTVELRNVTVAYNTDENIHSQSGTISMGNSIISGNIPNCTSQFSTGITSLQFNIANDDTCKLDSRKNDLIADPLLDSLADNGGFSFSHALLAGSLAIDSGYNPLCPDTDQRLFFRGDGKCDIGAFEVGSDIANTGYLEFETSESYQIEEDSNSGTSRITLPVRRAGGSEGVVTLHYTTTFGTASKSDYSATKGILSWIDGDSSNKNITVSIRSDDEYEPTETISVLLSTPGGGSSLGENTSANINILDNDFHPGIFGFENDTEGYREDSNFIKATVIREGGTDGAVSISLTTKDGKALAGQDYVSAQLELEFLPGEETKEIKIELIDDEIWEGDEGFSISLTDPQVIDTPFGGDQSTVPGIKANKGTVTATIFENESKKTGTVQFSSENYTVNEDAGTFEINIDRIGGTDDDIIVTVNSIIGGTAKSGEDFVRVSNEVSFSHGENTKPLLIAINDDAIFEEDETVILKIMGVSNGARVGELATTILTIKNNDSIRAGTVQFTETHYIVDVADGNITIPVSRINGSDKDIVAMISSTSESTAIAGKDYTLETTEVSFGKGETSQMLNISLINNNIQGNEKTIIIKLISATNGALIGESDTLTLTLKDDDLPSQNTGDQGAGDQSTGDQGAGDQGAGDQGAGDQGIENKASDGNTEIDEANLVQQDEIKSGSGSMDWFIFIAMFLLIGSRYRYFSRN